MVTVSAVIIRNLDADKRNRVIVVDEIVNSYMKGERQLALSRVLIVRDFIFLIYSWMHLESVAPFGRLRDVAFGNTSRVINSCRERLKGLSRVRGERKRSLL